MLMTGYFIQVISIWPSAHRVLMVLLQLKGDGMRTIGIERERFIVNSKGKIVPSIGTLLPRIRERAAKREIDPELFTYELFAGQIEDRIPPCKNKAEVTLALVRNDAVMTEAADELALAFDYSEMADANRIDRFEVNPFNERHAHIWSAISKERRIAASQVAAIHVHLAALPHEAVSVLNKCREDVVQRLIALGDHSGLRRIRAYQAMAEVSGVPPIFTSFDEIMNYIDSKGGEKNVWDLVRYKPSTKTVEFRMFGTTPNIDEILGYIDACCAVFP